jgi:hypothetical protein
LDDGQKVYIGSGGEFMPRGPTAKAAGGKTAGMIRAKLAKEGKGKPEAKPETPAKPFPEAFRAMNAAKAEHARLAGMHADKAPGVTQAHVDAARQKLADSRVELLRSKLAHERAQVAATAKLPEVKPAAAAKPAGERFSLLQRSATGAKGPENTGRGTTKFMFDMNKKDLKGQTSMFDRHAKGKP